MSKEKANTRSLPKADPAIGIKKHHLLDDALKWLDALTDKDGETIRSEVDKVRSMLEALRDANAGESSTSIGVKSGHIERVSRELEFTNHVITEAGKLSSADEICGLVCREIHNVNPNCLVTVAMVDPPKKKMTVKAFEGPRGLFERTLSFLGMNPVGLELDFDPETDREQISRRGKLFPLQGGLYQLMLGTLPKVFADYLEKILNIDNIFALEFSVEGQMYGGLTLIKPNGVKLNYTPSIETIANHMGAVFQRNQAVNALRESEDRYRTLFETAPFGIVRTTGKGLPLVWNKKMVNILGFDEIKDANGYYTDLGDQLYSDPEQRKEFLRLLKENGKVEDFEYEAIHRHGHHIWLRMDAIISGMTKDGGYIIDAYVNDVTQLRRAERRLHDENEVNRLIASLTKVLLTPVTLDEISRLVHDHAMKITGSEFVFVGYCENSAGIHAAKVTGDFWIENPEAACIPFHELRGALAWTFNEQSSLLVNELGNDIRTAGCRRGQDNISKIVSAPAMKGSNLIGLLAAAGNGEAYQEWDRKNLERLANIYAFAIERKQSENIINNALQEAEKADLLKTTLLQNMSHEIRTPINGIMGFADVLGEFMDEDGPQRDFILKIKKSASRLLSTLNGVITYATLSSSESKPDFVPLALNSQLEKIAAPYREQAGQKGLQFTLDLQGGELTVRSEDSLLAHCFGALLDNAVKFTSIGEINVTLRESEIDEKPFAEILISDTGIGIAEFQKDAVFDAFRQASEGLGRAYEGTGLGLAIAKRVIDMHDGRLSFTSEGKTGTTFRALIPLEEAEKESAIGEAAQSDSQSSKSPDSSERLKVLVVEDNEINSELIELYLSGLADITKADNGISAVAVAQESTFDLILMDINLGPGIDGIETMRMIQNETPNKTVPFVATTGYAGPGDKQMLLKKGFSQYLSKPFTQQELHSCLQNCKESINT